MEHIADVVDLKYECDEKGVRLVSQHGSLSVAVSRIFVDGDGLSW